MLQEILVKRGDQLPTIEATLTYENGAVIDLSGAGVTFQYRKTADSTIAVARNVSITDPVNGGVEYQWLTSDLIEAGGYVADFEIIFGDGRRLTVPTRGHIKMTVYDDLGDLAPPAVDDEEDRADQGAKYLYARNYAGT